MVARAAGLEVRHAVARQPEGPAAGRLGWDLHRDLALERRHGDLRAERRVVSRHRQGRVEVVARALEARVRAHRDLEVQVAPPGGILTSRLRRPLDHPPPRHRAHGLRLTCPAPPQAGQGSSSSSEMVRLTPRNASSSETSMPASTSPPLPGPKLAPRSPRSSRSTSRKPPERRPPRSPKIVRKKSEKPSPPRPKWTSAPSNGPRDPAPASA